MKLPPSELPSRMIVRTCAEHRASPSKYYSQPPSLSRQRTAREFWRQRRTGQARRRVRRTAVRAAIARLSVTGVPILGLVLNRTAEPFLDLE